MNPISHIINCFCKDSDFDVEEDFKEVMVNLELNKDFQIPNIESFQSATKNIMARDNIELNFIFDDMDPVIFHNKIDPSVFLHELKKYKILMDENSKIKLKIKIYKNIDKNFETSIYFFDKFVEHLLNISFVAALYNFKELLGNRPQIKFKIIDDTKEVEFGSNTFLFSSNEELSISPELVNREVIIESRNNIVYFYNAANYNFIPEDFFLIKKSDCEIINEFFEKIANIFSLIYITDFSNIKGDNELFFRLSGYKLIEETISFKEIQLDSILFKVYKWIYSGGNLSDKIGLARNIITLQLKVENRQLILSENVLNSIKSSYEIYLKENVAQYIEVKNKVSEFLLDLAQRISELANSFGNALKNNTFLFISYFLSVLIFNTISTGNITNIFTKDITYISYGLLAISLVYLCATIIQSRMERRRFITQYNRTKKMYEDILDKEDINSIFKLEDHEADLKFINKRVLLYSIVWSLEIITIFIIIENLKL